MSNKVEYEMSLKDMLTGKVNAADVAVNKFEGSVHSLRDNLGELGKIAATSLDVFAGVEFIKSSVEAYNEASQASAQLEASLTSTGGAIGVTTSALEEQAKAMQKLTLFDDDAVVKMDSVLATFTSIKGVVFTDAVPAILDLSAKMGQDLQSSAVQVGKALNDPIQGINALRRVGVSFSDSQQAVIKKLAETGHMAEAQQMILKELNKEFGGSAEAMAKVGSGPAQQLGNRLGDLKEEVGGLFMAVANKLIPVVDALINGFHAMMDWAKEHKDLLQAIGIGVLVAASAWGVYLIVTNAVSVATKIWTGIQWALNAAMDANPLGILIIAIGAAVAAVVYCYKHFAKFRAVLFGVWETIKEFGRIVGDIFTGLWHTIHGVFTLNPKEIRSGFEQSAGAILDAGTRLGGAFKKGFDDGMADFAKDQAAEKEANGPKAVKKAIGKVTPETPKAKETSKATGNKSISINIKIDNLIKEFKIETKNITESAGKVKELVTQAMLSAVNDSQIVAGQ